MAHALRRPRTRRMGPGASITGGRRSRRVSGAGTSTFALARAIRVVFTVLACLIVAAIVLRLLDANGTNVIVGDIHDAARWLVGPAHNLFSIHDPKLAITVNWGLAAIVYFVVGGGLARAILRLAPARRY